MGSKRSNTEREHGFWWNMGLGVCVLGRLGVGRGVGVSPLIHTCGQNISVIDGINNLNTINKVRVSIVTPMLVLECPGLHLHAISLLPAHSTPDSHSQTGLHQAM